jgi:hypothetical protein
LAIEKKELVAGVAEVSEKRLFFALLPANAGVIDDCNATIPINRHSDSRFPGFTINGFRMESVPFFWIDGMKPDHHLSGTEIMNAIL